MNVTDPTFESSHPHRDRPVIREVAVPSTSAQSLLWISDSMPDSVDAEKKSSYLSHCSHTALKPGHWCCYWTHLSGSLVCPRVSLTAEPFVVEASGSSFSHISLQTLQPVHPLHVALDRGLARDRLGTLGEEPAPLSVSQTITFIPAWGGEKVLTHENWSLCCVTLCSFCLSAFDVQCCLFFNMKASCHGH